MMRTVIELPFTAILGIPFAVVLLALVSCHGTKLQQDGASAGHGEDKRDSENRQVLSQNNFGPNSERSLVFKTTGLAANPESSKDGCWEGGKVVVDVTCKACLEGGMKKAFPSGCAEIYEITDTLLTTADRTNFYIKKLNFRIRQATVSTILGYISCSAKSSASRARNLTLGELKTAFDSERLFKFKAHSAKHPMHGSKGNPDACSDS